MNKIKSRALELMAGDCHISVRKAGSFRFQPSYRYEAHRHIEYEINYVSNGKCVMVFDTEYVPLAAGECIIITPYHNHGFLVDAKTGCKIQQVEADFRIPEHMKGEFPFASRSTPYFRVRDCEDVVPVIEQISRLHRNHSEDYRDALLEFAVLQMIITLGYHTKKTKNAMEGIKNEKILGIMRYIQMHYCEPIRIEELAGNWGVSSRYVRRYFAEEIGMSCSDYIMTMRMNKAKKLLWETRKSITGIALETGFGSSQHFCRAFRNAVGMSPSVYRSSWREEQ